MTTYHVGCRKENENQVSFLEKCKTEEPNQSEWVQCILKKNVFFVTKASTTVSWRWKGLFFRNRKEKEREGKSEWVSEWVSEREWDREREYVWVHLVCVCVRVCVRVCVCESVKLIKKIKNDQRMCVCVCVCVWVCVFGKDDILKLMIRSNLTTGRI